MELVTIQTEIITLGQFLKVANIIDSGGMAKHFLSTQEVLVNGEKENRRGRKLRNSDTIVITSIGTFTIVGA